MGGTGNFLHCHMQWKVGIGSSLQHSDKGLVTGGPVPSQHNPGAWCVFCQFQKPLLELCQGHLGVFQEYGTSGLKDHGDLLGACRGSTCG